jgi:hypothetical protein
MNTSTDIQHSRVPSTGPMASEVVRSCGARVLNIDALTADAIKVTQVRGSGIAQHEASHALKNAT